jgi:hypothetical protein
MDDKPNTKDKNLLDLDVLTPEPKTVKIGGKIYKCYPPTLRQLIKIATLKDLDTTEPENIEKKVLDVLSTIIPGIENDEVELNILQLHALIDFVNDMASPEKLEKAKAYSVEKKINSPKE